MELDKDFQSLARLIRGFEQLADKHQMDMDTINKFQHLLDRFAEKYQNDQAAGSRRFMLYEMQALLWHVRGDYDKAVDFLKEAADYLRGDHQFVSNAGRSWAQQEAE